MVSAISPSIGPSIGSNAGQLAPSAVNAPRLPKSPSAQLDAAQPCTPRDDFSLIEKIAELIARILQLIAICALCAYITVQLLRHPLHSENLELLWAVVFSGYLGVALLGAKASATLLALARAHARGQQNLVQDQVEEQQRELELLRGQMAQLQQRLVEAAHPCGVGEESLRLEACSECVLEQLLHLDQREVMLALAKVRAAPACFITWDRILDAQDRAILSTSSKIVYSRKPLLKWLEQSATCPFTSAPILYIILPDAAPGQQFQALRDGALPGCDEQEQLRALHIADFQRRMQKLRSESICSVNRKFGKQVDFLDPNALA